MPHQELSLGSLPLDPLVHHGLPGLVNTYKEIRRSQSSHPASMDLQGRSMWPDMPDEHEYLPYHLKGLEVDELKEMLEGCGFLSDTGGSVNISFIADSIRRRILIPASSEQPAHTDVRLNFTASVSHCPLCGATCSSLSQQLEGSVEELSQMSCDSNAQEPSDGIAARRSHEPMWQVSLELSGRW